MRADEGEFRWQLGEAVVAICRRASSSVMEFYLADTPVAIEQKQDLSPVTEADHRAHDLIVAGLNELLPNTPILSEEDDIPAFAVRQRWQRYWLIDPLDGTREFIRRSGEYTINIALIENHRATLGVIAAPAEHTIYMGVPGMGAVRYETGNSRTIAVAPVADALVRVLTGHRRENAALRLSIESLQQRFERVELQRLGSALKFCRLAEGVGDICPGLFRCYEWDIAAGQALLEAAGGKMLTLAGTPVRYNLADELTSPHFFATAGQNVDWNSIIIPA